MLLSNSWSNIKIKSLDINPPYKWKFVGLFDVSEASRIPKPRDSGAIRYLAGACSEPAIAGERNLR